jgi:hypothetical protein
VIPCCRGFALLAGSCKKSAFTEALYEFARSAPTVTTTFAVHAADDGHATCCVLWSIGSTDDRLSFSALATWRASARFVLPGR